MAHGPRGPTSYYYMLPMKVRVRGLTVALTVKLTQDNLHIVDSLDLPTADPQYLTELARYRRWGDTVLLVDMEYEDTPQNMVEAASRLKTFTLVPAVGGSRTNGQLGWLQVRAAAARGRWHRAHRGIGNQPRPKKVFETEGAQNAAKRDPQDDPQPQDFPSAKPAP